MMHGYSFGSSMFMRGGIFMFIFWILIAVVIISMFSSSSRRDKLNLGKDHRETPMEILKKRYAKGEITEREYEDMKEKLKD